MFKLIKDFFLFPFQKDSSNNKFKKLLDFVFRDYPAYFWKKPSLKAGLLFPVLIIYMVFIKKD